MSSSTAAGASAAPSASASASPLPDTLLARDFPHIAALPRTTLEALATNSDPQYYSALIHTEPRIAALLTQRSELLRRARELARRNEEELRPPLEAVREETKRYFVQAKQAEEIEWREEERRLAEAHRRFAPSALLAQLQQAMARIYEQSEDLANALIEGRPLPPHLLAAARDLAAPASSSSLAANVEDSTGADLVQTFIKAFLTLRTAYHRRAMLEERWRRDSVRLG